MSTQTNLKNKEPEIRLLPETQLIGIRRKMSIANNLTVPLWQSFMPRRNEIAGIGSEMYSIQVYEPSFDFQNFDIFREFEKWAAREVNHFSVIPDGMESLIIPEGLYAVFQYRGLPVHAESSFRYIFGAWVPQSGYELDHRPHFEILGEKYKRDSEDSEEEIWIPIKK